ncbi:SipW-dependent-type signal peptide-containing protein [Microbacterium oxydans]|uniref:SipW-dependent-type signal peptide-containing protein n=1 Tax=Microbacterium oxydans TaxID=82380 RepID=UPI0022B1DBA1|nr:SipW-dependent-type signal peptide-containing protein [Microbacterium oxydans]MCZ4301662.1 SipW-dependent-type signal peptide-containing protein [Microbacterium oxydans]
MASKETQRKVLAVLAGGLVLGVGVAVTLAAWNDSEFANGTFTAGAFNLEGSTDGTTFSDHNTDDGDAAATLAFSLPAGVVDNMSPTDSVYAGFWVRLAAGTTSAADLEADGTTADAAGISNSDHLSYQIYQLAPGDTCDATTAVGTPIATGATLDAQTGVTAVALAPGATAIDPGVDVQLCIKVTADADLEPSLVTDATWKFTATSTN